MKTKLGMMCFAALLVHLVQAADVAFLGEDSTGSGDLSEPSHWAGGVLPGSSTAVSFGLSGILGNSKDASFGQMTLNAGPNAFRMEHSVTVNGNFLIGSKNSSVSVLTGSVINVTGSSAILKMAYQQNVAYGCQLRVIGQGAKFAVASTSTDSVIGGHDRSWNNLVHVADHAELVLPRLNFCKLSATQSGTNNTILIEDYGVMKILGSQAFNLGNATAPLTTGKNECNKLLVRTGGSLYLGRPLVIGGGYSNFNRCELSGEGSLIDTTTAGNADGGFTVGAGGVGNELEAFGNVKLNAADKLGGVCVGSVATSRDNAMTVRDGATLVAWGEAYVGNAGSSNRLTVANAAGFTVTNSASNLQRHLYIGYAASATGNVVTVSNTPSFSVRYIEVGTSGSDNRCEFRNAPWRPYETVTVGVNSGATGNSFILHGTGTWARAAHGASFGASSVNNRIRIEGYAGDFGLLNFGVPTPATGNVYEIGTGIDWTVGALTAKGGPGNPVLIDGASLRQTGANTYNTIWKDQDITVGNGSTVAMTNGYRFALGWNEVVDTDIMSNRLAIRDGSVMSVSDLRVSGCNNEILVSNATFFVNQAFNFPEIRNMFQPTYGFNRFCTNNWIRLEGASPRFTADVAMSFGYGEDAEGMMHVGDTRIAFKVPPEGYIRPPLEALESAAGDARNIFFAKSTKMLVDLSCYDAEDAQKIVLARASGMVSASDLEELGSELPANCRLFVSDDKHDLVLKIKGKPKGLMLILR